MTPSREGRTSFPADPTADFVFNKEGFCLYVSEKLLHILGYAAPELMGRSFGTFVETGGRGEVDNLFQGLTEKPATRLETRFRHRDGTTFSLSWTAQWLNRDRHLYGKLDQPWEVLPDGVFCTICEKEEQQQNSVLRQMLDRITDGFVALDESWHITYANKACEQLLNLNKYDYLGQNLWQAFPELDGSIIYEQYHKAMRQNMAVRFEAFVPGLEKYLDVNAYPSQTGLSVFFKDISRRKAIEEENRRLSLIVKKTTNLVVTTAADGKVTWVNEAFVKKTGYSLEEVKDRFLRDVLHGPETSTETARYIDDQTSKGLPFDAEILNYTKDQKAYWVAFYAQPVYGKDGRVNQYFAIQTDITERKKTEAERKAFKQKIIAQHQRLAGILEHMNQGFFAFDASLQVQSWNHKAAEITGIPAENAVGEVITSLYPEAALAFYIPLFRQALEEKASQHHEFFCLQCNKWVELDIYPSEEGVSVFFKDISNRKRTENELKRLSLIAQETENAVLLVTPDRKTTWVNAAFTRMTGYTFDEIVGKKPASLLEGPETDPAIEKLIEENYRKKIPFQFEVLNYKKNGEPFWSEIHLEPLFDERGNVEQYFSIRKDITEQKRMAKELEDERKRTTAAVIAAQENERSFVSQELHDSVNPVLTTVKLYQDLILSYESSRVELAGKSRQLLQESILEIRRLSKRLSVPVKGIHALYDSVRELIYTIEDTNQFAVDADIESIQELKIPDDLHLGVYRIL